MKNGTNIQNLGKKNQTEREGKFNLKSDANQSLTVRSIDRIPPPLILSDAEARMQKIHMLIHFWKYLKSALAINWDWPLLIKSKSNTTGSFQWLSNFTTLDVLIL